MHEAFLAEWEQHDGLLLLGFPLNEETSARAADGIMRPLQVFERGVLAYYAEDNSVRLEPLGWAMLVRAQLQQSTATQQIR